MARFAKGTSGNPHGRHPGVQNIATREFKAVWKAWMEGDEYLASLKRRILAGRAPHAESYLLALIYGKPRDVIEQQGELRIICELPSDDE